MLKRILKIFNFFLWPIYFLSFLTKRDSKIWVYGSHVGFSGNSKYFFIYMSQSHKSITNIWIAKNKEEVDYIRTLGFKAYYKFSIKGIYYQLVSNCYIFTFHLIDISFWLSGTAKRINLWHGIGLKRIEFNVTTGPSSLIYKENNIVSRLLVPYIFCKPDILLSTSELMTNVAFKNAFRINKNNVIEACYPRNEILSLTEKTAKRHINRYELEKTKDLSIYLDKYKKIYLYMPTWRDLECYFNYNLFEESGFDFLRLNDLMIKKDALFLIKLHPGSSDNFVDLSKYTNIKLVDKNIDIYPILNKVSTLITDYSSIYYDYLLLNRPTIFFIFDIDNYLSKNRDLTLNFNDYTGGKKVYHFSELLDAIDTFNEFTITDDKLSTLFWQYPDRNNQYIYKEIYNRLFR